MLTNIFHLLFYPVTVIFTTRNDKWSIIQALLINIYSHAPLDIYAVNYIASGRGDVPKKDKLQSNFGSPTPQMALPDNSTWSKNVQSLQTV